MTTLEDHIAKLEALAERQAGIIERQAAIIVEKDAQIARLTRRVEDLERRLGERDGGGNEPPQSGEGSRASRRDGNPVGSRATRATDERWCRPTR